jgi:hypothetical protein
MEGMFPGSVRRPFSCGQKDRQPGRDVCNTRLRNQSGQMAGCEALFV